MKSKKKIGLFLFLIGLLSINQIQAQETILIQGVITEADTGNPIPGATVVVKNTTTGTTTDFDGNYSINVNSNAILEFSSLGFTKQEIAIKGKTTINISLAADSQQLDEVVITGVLDPRTRMDASVAISVIGLKELEMAAPLSAADLLKNVPGVYVNSSLGEVRNTVYSRGVSVGSNDGASGYYYVSLQEDGLPVTNATYANYGPDYFLRADATLKRLEAVRGGTASILGNNAPGGIFNYISKTGGDTFEGEIRAKFGIEGDGNPYYRTDANFGGPLSKDKTLRYNIGGFYRESDGPRNPGYTMNNGGQIKANLVKNWENGSLKLYTKFLSDHNAWFEFTPTIGFDDPKYPTGIDKYTSVYIPPVSGSFEINDSGEYRDFNSEDKIHSQDLSIGLNFDQNLGNNWKFDNKMRYSDKSSIWNSTAINYPFAVDGLVFYAIIGQLGQFGTYNFNDLQSNSPLASIGQLPILDGGGNFLGFDFPVYQSTLPGEEVLPNALFFQPLFFTENKVKEFIDQVTISKRYDNMSFTAGAFYANSSVKYLNGSSGVVFSAINQDRPSATSITYDDFEGNTFQLTNPEGIFGGGSGSSSAVDMKDVKQNQFALFFGHNWDISEKLNVDWGIRYESIGVKGTNQIANSFASEDGGVDGNPLTVYDNAFGQITDTFDYDEKSSTFSFSGGLNYRINEKFAIYGRYSEGEKAPDLGIYLGVDTSDAELFLNPIAQKIQQAEMGFKSKLANGNGNIFITPFYSLLSNVANQQTGLETDDISSGYSTPILYNKYETYGVEVEADVKVVENFSVRAVATFQKATALEFQTWILGANGQADDTIQEFSGNETDNSANTILRITPTYNNNKFLASLEWSYLGERAANIPNAFSLPAFSQTNLTLGYRFNTHINLQVNINNVFDQIGIMGWSAPGGFPAALDRQGFTKEMLDANPNAVYSTLSIPPTSYYLTFTYSF